MTPAKVAAPVVPPEVPATTPEVKVNYPVDKTSFTEGQLQSTKALAFSDTAGNLYYVLIYSELPDQEGKFTATLAKIYKSDGLAWSFNHKLSFVPKELQFATLTGELTIVGPGGELTTMDKSGKVKTN